MTSAADTVRFRVPRDVWIGLGALALAFVYGAGARTIPVSPLDGVVNARVLPEALAGALALFSLLLIARALLLERVRLAAARAAATPQAVVIISADERRANRQRHLKAAGVLGIGLVFLIILPWIGYLPAMTLLVFAAATYIGASRPWRTLAVAVGVAAVFYLLFDRLLSIPLPQGPVERLLP